MVKERVFSLRDLQLDVSYSTDQGIVERFYVPCLKHAALYRRAVGYFTSSGLAVAAEGIAHFIESGGEIRLIASPQLSEQDIDAISAGYESRDAILKRSVAKTFTNLEDMIVKDRLNALAWLISSGQLNVKLALRVDSASRRLRRGIYHEKIGIFSDLDGNHIAFTGSPNETEGGLVENFESVDVFWSWDDPHGRIQRKIEHFDNLWGNSNPQLEVLEFTEISREILEVYKARTPPRHDPLEGTPVARRGVRVGIPRVPESITLRDYQIQAVTNWFRNNGKGILQMATGTGKTITALAAAAKLYSDVKLQALIVVCPYRHLVTQWQTECRRFGLEPLLAFESRTTWVDSLSTQLFNVAAGTSPFSCVITTNSTFSGASFQRKLPHFPQKTLLIADEVHNLGAEKLRASLPAEVPFRLGLSATPERWFDDAGTSALLTYFGEVLEPKLTIKEAIAKKALVPYRYYPIIVELTEQEQQEYLEVSEKISRMSYLRGLDEEPTALTALQVRRARLIATARNKLGALRELMKDQLNRTHVLFYCGDGTVEDDVDESVIRQVEAVSKLLGYELGFRVSTYTAETSLAERESLTRRLDSGELQGLVAIRCLDEGVDIPSVQAAVILASSTNPRQFIQRRGRVLRRSPGKDEAQIFDMIVVPPIATIVTEAERALVRKELTRFIEFADMAKNAGEARGKILDLQMRYNLMDL